jgi:hypothetical protein
MNEVAAAKTPGPAEVHARFVNEVVVEKRIALLDDLFIPDAKPQGNLECFVIRGNDKPRAWIGQSSISARSSTASESFTTRQSS